MPKSGNRGLVVALLMAQSCATSLHAASDMFLSFVPEIKGESADKAHTNKVDVLAWSWGLANSGTTHAGTGGATGKASFQDLSLTKYVDKASPKLMERCANGKPLSEATLIVRTAGATPVEYLKIKFEEVLVSSVSTGGSGGEDRLTENVTFNFARLSLTYTPITDAPPPTSPQFTWDVITQSAIATNAAGGGEPPAGGVIIPPLAATLTYTNGAPMAWLTWRSYTNTTYQVWSASELEGPFQRYGSPMPSAGDGTTSIIVPADALRKFFHVETLPAQ